MREYRNDDNITRLIERTRHTDRDAFRHIADLYSDMLHRVINSCGFCGYDYDDMFQEAQMGLFKAVMTYDNRYSSFSTYAYICVKSSVVSFLRKSSAKSNIPQNMLFSLSDEDVDAVNSTSSPESEFIGKESFELLTEKIDGLLSPLERRVLTLYLSGRSYAEIADELGKSEKSVDNAVQRIRRKLKCLKNDNMPM